MQWKDGDCIHETVAILTVSDPLAQSTIQPTSVLVLSFQCDDRQYFNCSQTIKVRCYFSQELPTTRFTLRKTYQPCLVLLMINMNRFLFGWYIRCAWYLRVAVHDCVRGS